MKSNVVVQGDCIEKLSALKPGSVDLAFADPPFNIGYEYDEYDDEQPDEVYLDWSKRWMGEVVRVLKPDGTFWLAIGDEYAAELKVLATRELGLTCRNWVVWFYTFGVHCKRKFTRSHAHLFYFVRNPKSFTFNADAIRVPSARQLVYGDRRADPDGRVPDDTWMITPALPPEVPTRDGFILRPQDIPDRFPPHSDTWYFPRVCGTFKERGGVHGCQMPEQLLGRIIRACSNEGDLVLDPFAGSGTTLAVAKKLKRRYMGVELSKKYTCGVEQRLKTVCPGDELIGSENATLSSPRTKAGRHLRLASSLAPIEASHSPVVAKANVSLGQVAVANGELSTAVAEAFMAAHQGYSTDRVLADPALNERFLHNCQLLGVPGEAKDWNHLLLNTRKRGGLAAIDTLRRTFIRHDRLNPFIFASEIAWRSVSMMRDCTLDDILCDPSLAIEFSKIAESISPGYSPFEYRWAALAIRKDASKGLSVLQDVNSRLAPRVFTLSEQHRLPQGPGHYLITLADTPFFVGFADSLRDCRFFHPAPMTAASEAMNEIVKNEDDIAIRTRIFDFTAIKRIYNEKEETPWRSARRAKLMERYDPIANIPLAGSAA